MKIIFTEDYETKEANPKKYERGQVENMEDASANHFINRGIAEKYSAKKEREVKKGGDHETAKLETPETAAKTGQN